MRKISPPHSLPFFYLFVGFWHIGFITLKIYCLRFYYYFFSFHFNSDFQRLPLILLPCSSSSRFLEIDGDSWGFSKILVGLWVTIKDSLVITRKQKQTKTKHCWGFIFYSMKFLLILWGFLRILRGFLWNPLASYQFFFNETNWINYGPLK